MHLGMFLRRKGSCRVFGEACLLFGDECRRRRHINQKVRNAFSLCPLQPFSHRLLDRLIAQPKLPDEVTPRVESLLQIDREREVPL